VEAAKAHLVGRRFLHVQGPFGLGLKVVPQQDVETEAGWVPSQSLPVVMIQQPFTLGVRDLAAFEHDPLALDTRAVQEATLACAEMEDDLLFNGTAGMPGLQTAEGVNQLDLSAWDEVGTAANDITQAITSLDGAGFHGPYALAIAPARYNQLFRLYPRGNKTELDHLKTMITKGIFKAPILEAGGLLMNSGSQIASIVLGQDMSVGFIGPAGPEVEFTISESLALALYHPEAICVLKG
jgi:uncharacterized linocin/CFP29 family protein